MLGDEFLPISVLGRAEGGDGRRWSGRDDPGDGDGRLDDALLGLRDAWGGGWIGIRGDQILKLGPGVDAQLVVRLGLTTRMRGWTKSTMIDRLVLISARSGGSPCRSSIGIGFWRKVCCRAPT